MLCSQPRIRRRERLVGRLLHAIENDHSNTRENNGRKTGNKKGFHGNHSSPVTTIVLQIEKQRDMSIRRMLQRK